MPLGVPNPNPPTPPSQRPSGGRSSRSNSGGSTTIPGARPVSEGAQGQGPVAPGTMAPRNSPYSTFQSSPEYSNQGAWSGWEAAAPQGTQQYATGVLGETFNALSGGNVDLRQTNQQYYEAQYGKEAVEQAMRSGMDPAVYFSLGSAAQQQAAQWGTNLPNQRSIIEQQQAAYDQQFNQQQQNNSYIDQFGAIQTMNQDNLLAQYANGAGMAQGRYDLGINQLEQGLHTDLGLLGERRYRDVDLAGADNAAALNHNGVMRGVLDERRGIRGDQFGQQQDYLNQQTGFLNERQTNAYDRFQSQDAYSAGLSQDLMAQYGFNTRQFDQTTEENFANRSTQRRAASSDAAARGAFGSSGFGDNISDIQGQYQRSQDANTLRLDQGNESLDVRDRAIGNDRANQRFNYTDQTIGFNTEAAGIQNAHANNINNYRDDLASYRGQYSSNDLERTRLQNVDKGLSSLAKEYGIQEQDMRNQFDNAVTKMGLDLQETNQQLEQMLNSGNAQLMAQGMQFMQQMMAYQ